jgi:hypothetical protein
MCQEKVGGGGVGVPVAVKPFRATWQRYRHEYHTTTTTATKSSFTIVHSSKNHRFNAVDILGEGRRM